jgi:hypothetical protein
VLSFFYPFGSATEEILQQTVTIRSVLRLSKTVEALHRNEGALGAAGMNSTAAVPEGERSAKKIWFPILRTPTSIPHC